MILTPADSTRYYQIWWPLLTFVNAQQNVVDDFHVDYAFYPSKGYVINIFKSNKSLDGFYAVVVLRIKIENGEPTEVCILQDGVICRR